MTPPQPHRLTRECRALLRGESATPLRAHAEQCAFCADWLRRRIALQNLLRAPMAPLSENESARLLTGIRERIVEQCEQGPIGHALGEAMPVAAVPETAGGWPEPLLSSEIAEQLAPNPSAAPTARDWTAVRNAVLEDIAGTATRRTARYRLLAGVGLAAALVISVVLLRGRDTPRQAPRIVFVDVSAVPDLDFAPMTWLREGGDR